MSQVHQTTQSNLADVYPVSNLALVVLLLIPCVVILLVLNCLFLGYKLLILSKMTDRREDNEAMRLQSNLHEARRLSDVTFAPLPSGRRAYMSLSEPALAHPVTSSRASSKERPGFDQRIRLLRPDGATGSGSLREPSTIRASSAVSPRLDLRSALHRRDEWRRSPALLQQLSRDSDGETRVNLVPPNSPVLEAENAEHICRSSPYDMQADVHRAAEVHLFDKMDMECELSNTLSEVSCIVTSALGSGLDSDFGASAGVSLRILSADSDCLSSGAFASALEWDYYDPCYVKQNNVSKHKHHKLLMHAKQYWV